jgi:hypothetical protein
MMIANHKQTLLRMIEGGMRVFALRKTPAVILIAVLARPCFHRSQREKQLDPDVKTSSNLAYFPAVQG